MGDDSSKVKRRAHELIDQLAPSQTTAVVALLESILDPVTRAISNAPIDDEPLIAEEEQALNESREWSNRHSAIPHEQVLRELGITQEDLNRFLK